METDGDIMGKKRKKGNKKKRITDSEEKGRKSESETWKGMSQEREAIKIE